MSFSDEIIDFTIKGFEQTGAKIVTNGKHKHVLKNKEDNFFGKQPKFELHKWAGSLKSSQAFAYNIFSGMKESEFEFHMKVFDRDSQIDVKIEDVKTQTSELFEVKMFEIIGMGKIKFEEKYFTATEYKCPDIAEPFIEFLRAVTDYFEKKGQRVYGGGIKQLCSHLLGIINEMIIPDGKLVGKKSRLYSLCFDNPFLPEFKNHIENYKNALKQFKKLTDEFLKEIMLDAQIDYYGFLPASEYIKKNEKALGKENCDYVMKRYFHNQSSVK